MENTASYLNPWHIEGRNDYYGPRFYTTSETPTKYRGCLIYHRHPSAWEVVKDGVCLTQRAGMRGAREAIDNMLDNPSDYWAQRMLGYLTQFTIRSFTSK